MIINVLRSSYKVTNYSSHMFMKLEFYQKIFEKFSDKEFCENPSFVEPRFCTRADGRTHRWHFRNFAEKCLKGICVGTAVFS